eukprot:GABV01001318.1.p1 GENE.GABV01001318.1~~GABV01001318.1.p1  ORF type:complete len:161 (-),score=63.59 GABV01001318.1:443-877(-)
MGVRPYAVQVMKLIDPEDQILEDNLVTRDDHAGMGYKDVQRLFPCDESMVVIVDDRADVWKTPDNVIKIHKFLYWPRSDFGRQDFSAAGLVDDNEELSPTERAALESGEWTAQSLQLRGRDNVLVTIGRVLEAIHSVFSVWPRK